MNKTFEKAGKEILLNLLSQLTESQQSFYAKITFNNPDLHYTKCVEMLDPEKIDHSITLCERTIEKNKNKQH